MRKKKWKAVVTRREDVIVVKIALLLRELPYQWLREPVIRKAFAFNGDKLSTEVPRNG